MAEIELLQTAGEKWTFYLEPILFHNVIALLDSPRLLVCVCGVSVGLPNSSYYTEICTLS